MNEFDLIARIARSLPANAAVVQGAGDDCAVLDLGLPGKLLLFKTDALVQGVHFTAETPAAMAGRKALARALSDIAAMAGLPVACLVTLGLPEGFEPDWVFAFYEGLNELAKELNVAIAGGETTRNPGGIFVSMTLLGTIPRERIISRANARPGEAIFVTGELGGSIEGKHLEFTPRLREADWLAAHFPIRAMMDLSDGLAGDLRRILDASKVGAEILAGAIPISRAARLKAKSESSAKPPLLAALTDGEDFELLFTAPAKDAVRLLDAWRAAFRGTKLSCIGKITAHRGLRISDKNGTRDLAAHGYTHFQ
jgi:thiamine-monophosphate kinase